MVNPIRGEAILELGGLTVTMAATMEGLAQLSVSEGRPTLPELYRRMSTAEISTTITAVRLFCQRVELNGKEVKPLRKGVNLVVGMMTIGNMPKFQAALMTILSGLTGEEEDGDGGNE